MARGDGIPPANRAAVIVLTCLGGHELLRAGRYTDPGADPELWVEYPTGGKQRRGGGEQDGERLRVWCDTCGYERQMNGRRLRAAVDLLHAHTPSGGQQVVRTTWDDLVRRVPPPEQGGIR